MTAPADLDAHGPDESRGRMPSLTPMVDGSTDARISGVRLWMLSSGKMRCSTAMLRSTLSKPFFENGLCEWIYANSSFSARWRIR